MIYGSVCSGIEAATVAWHPLGWKPAFYSEIEPLPRAVLAHHYPTVPLHGDFTTIQAGDYADIDLLVGGTPCQDFSIAGLRAGMDGDRGNLTLQFLTLAGRLRPQWLVWENVPGVLSSNGGRDFGAFLGGLGELGYGWAYRTLDAQFFGVPQRRRRVFAVGCLGDWRRAAAVLFERHSLQGHSTPRREARSPVAALTSSGVGTCGADDNQAQAGHLIPIGIDGSSDTGHCLTATATATATGRLDPSMHTYVSEVGTPLAPVADTLTSHWHQSNGAKAGNNVGMINPVSQAGGVRRLTPRECERLQGFPDDYTAVPYRGKPAADGPRYKALGNSMAVPCMRWIGERIQAVENLTKEIAA